MLGSSAFPFTRVRYIILGLLLILAAAAWIFLLQQSARTGAGMGLTMGMSAPLFLAIWIAMMVAMMFPTAAPMILAFSTLYQRNQERGDGFVPTWVFVGGYLALWTLFGVLAYIGALLADALAGQSMWLMEKGPRIGGTLLVIAGVYQLSPLKNICLSKCRTPMQFILSSWRSGFLGSVRMGVEHGIYCLGCCWLLFVILFPLGMMNVAAMALITALIFAEKSLAWGRQIGFVAALALVVYGIWIVLNPDALPTMVSMDTM